MTAFCSVRMAHDRSRMSPQSGRAKEPFEFNGLGVEEVLRRRQESGANALPRPARAALWRRLLAQFVHFFAVMLWSAGGLAILAGMPQLGFAIFVVIVLNALFAFAQEYRAERASEQLRDLLPRRVTVVREAKRQRIDATELVPGDLVVLDAGDGISADLRLEQVHGLAIDTSTLTGESVPANPAVGEAVLAGTFVVEGEAIGIVTATGRATRLAHIAQMTVEKPRPVTPLGRELNRVVRVISLVCLAVGFAFLAVALLVGIRLTDAFLFALGVTVALVPEGLLPTISLSLALGAQKMAARGALVRRLESVETLGSTTFICTDKTGTLTRNEMSVTQAWTPHGEASIEGTGYDPAGRVRADPRVLPVVRELVRAAALHGRGRALRRGGRWLRRAVRWRLRSMCVLAASTSMSSRTRPRGRSSSGFRSILVVVECRWSSAIASSSKGHPKPCSSAVTASAMPGTPWRGWRNAAHG